MPYRMSLKTTPKLDPKLDPSLSTHLRIYLEENPRPYPLAPLLENDRYGGVYRKTAGQVEGSKIGVAQFQWPISMLIRIRV